MENIKKKYILDSDQKAVAVQIGIADFEMIERVLEDYALGKFIEENDPSENLNLKEAKKFYDQLEKKG